MRKLVFPIIVLALLMSGTMVHADNITLSQAKDVAAHFLQHNTSLERITPEDLTLVRQLDNEVLGVPSMYMFNANDCGWIIIAGTTVLHPVVAYNDEGPMDFNDMPENAEGWFLGYNEGIKATQIADAQKGLADSPEWFTLSNHNLKGNTKDTEVTFMSEKWGQGKPTKPTYNLYCPKVDGQYCYVGCVATAMAQICHYYQYPVKATGYRSYVWSSPSGNKTLQCRYSDSAIFDYSIMPDKVLQYSTSTESKIMVARLCYYLGVSVKMHYGIDGSGAQSEDVPSAMKNFFKYKRGTQIYRNNVGTTEFISKMRADLLLKRPVYFSAYSPSSTGRDAGHAFLATGYREVDQDFYYFNWGWDGSSNGWCNVTANNMQANSEYNFTDGQDIIIDMVPPADSTGGLYYPQVGISDVPEGIELGIAYPNPASYSVNLPYSAGQATELKIFSVDGKMIESRSVAAGNGVVEVRVDEMPKGVYIYRMGDAYGKFIVK